MALTAAQNTKVQEFITAYTHDYDRLAAARNRFLVLSNLELQQLMSDDEPFESMRKLLVIMRDAAADLETKAQAAIDLTGGEP